MAASFAELKSSGNALLALADFDGALAVYTEALAAAGKGNAASAEVVSNMSLAWLRSGQSLMPARADEAKEHFAQASKYASMISDFDPSFPTNWDRVQDAGNAQIQALLELNPHRRAMAERFEMVEKQCASPPEEYLRCERLRTILPFLQLPSTVATSLHSIRLGSPAGEYKEIDGERVFAINVMFKDEVCMHQLFAHLEVTYAPKGEDKVHSMVRTEGECLWDVAMKLRTHYSECDAALRMDGIEYVRTHYLDSIMHSASRETSQFFAKALHPQGKVPQRESKAKGRARLAMHYQRQARDPRNCFFEESEVALSIYFELGRYRAGCRAMAAAIISGPLLHSLGALAARLDRMPRLTPELEDLKAKFGGNVGTRSQLEQALIDTLGRVLVGVGDNALLLTELVRVLDADNEAFAPIQHLITSICETPTARTQWTNLADSAPRFNTLLEKAKKTQELKTPWLPHYSMERSFLSHATSQTEQRCNTCLISRDASSGGKMHKCSRCNNALYCSIACQKKDWKGGHKASCIPLLLTKGRDKSLGGGGR